MTLFDSAHLLFLSITILFLLTTMFIVSKLNRTWQNIMFFVAVILCSGGIFFRYGMGLKITTNIDWKAFALQMLQVCNFNFILLPLMLFKKCEIARQYSIFFSMFAASTTLISLSSDWANYEWNSIVIINSWLNHTFAIACPLWMLAARVLKPKKEYMFKVLICVISYFTLVWIISANLKSNNIIDINQSYSFIYDTMNIPILDLLYKIIPYPYFYLYPLLPIVIIFFKILSLMFNEYRVIEY